MESLFDQGGKGDHLIALASLSAWCGLAGPLYILFINQFSACSGESSHVCFGPLAGRVCFVCMCSVAMYDVSYCSGHRQKKKKTQKNRQTDKTNGQDGQDTPGQNRTREDRRWQTQ